MVFEDIAHRDELDIFGAGHQVDDGLGPASAAADEARFELLLARTTNQFGPKQCKCGRAKPRGGCFAEERSPGKGIRVVFHVV